jgi:hypothetical protein
MSCIFWWRLRAVAPRATLARNALDEARRLA